MNQITTFPRSCALKRTLLSAGIVLLAGVPAGAGETLPWQGSAAKAAAAAAEQAKPPPADASPPAAASTPETLPKETGDKSAAPAKGAPLIPAKKLFGAAKEPAPLKARAIGAYSRGCLAGATSLAIDGPGWQAMRLSRNRNWGHPKLISLLERFASEVKEKDGWPGLLVGDISQPRGGPMLTGHASHQLGLDADIWFTPMPARRLTRSERENLSATSMLASDNLSVNPKVWGKGQVNIVRRIASYKEVERVLVHPAIKKALCEAADKDREWLSKVRPYWGHFYHFHVRIACPADSPSCNKQAPIPGGDGCDKELEDWYKLLTAPPRPKPVKPTVPVKPKPPLTLADLPAECAEVIDGTTVTETASTPPKPASEKRSTSNAKPAAKPASKTSSAGPQ